MNVPLKIAILETVRSQIRLSVITGISEDKLSRIVNGWQRPTARERYVIAQALQRPEAELFKGTTAANTGNSEAEQIGAA